MISSSSSKYCVSQSLNSTLKTAHNQYLSFRQCKSFLRHTCIAFTSSSSSTERPKWDSKIRFCNKNHCKNGAQNNNDEEETEEKVAEEVVILGDRKVHCAVEVVSWRERRIKGEISVNADVESVWNALTDYERLADFIPNLVSR